jgi:hypothetical protein
VTVQISLEHARVVSDGLKSNVQVLTRDVGGEEHQSGVVLELE